MKIMFTTHKIAEANVYPNSYVGPGISYSIMLSFGVAPPFPSETVEVSNAAQIAEKLADYCERAKATGIPLQAGWIRPSNDRSRAFPGFTKLKEGKETFTCNTEALDAAAWAKFNAEKQPA